ncbi:DUF1905 domain-containing protein [Homoserinibacter sp. GY 40078]|uniref:DUF1905 domain-containing protein n=1 Tax=Homoserinibacter sp. GY 40078 TaxID=2603275 RepID=UPI0011C7584F|nr:DUF1905 domain-containing protein [Homoserinibacter sp. GY 40078]TXK17627.1 DUF1905 domain-containing protein [Homoserinibacter sp. GY 40078]
MRYRFLANVQRWEARVRDDWYFVDIPAEPSAEIHEWADARPRAGFGAVKVRARLGSTSWSTSVFPSASGVYSLVLNARVRRVEGVAPGDTVEVEVEITG